MALTPKQQRFCEEYIVDCNGKQAAIRAGYSPNGAEVRASELLTNSKVSEYLSELTKEVTEDRKFTARDTLDTIERVVKACEADDAVKNAAAILKGCELYGKHHKLFTDKIEHSGKDGGPIEYTNTERAARLATILERARKERDRQPDKPV